MTIIHQWTTKLAEIAVPEEIYLASSIADIYILESQTMPVNDWPASESPSEISKSICEPCSLHLTLPIILQQMSASSHHIVNFLTSKEVQEIATTISLYTTAITGITKIVGHRNDHNDSDDSDVTIEEVNIQLKNDHPLAKTLMNDLVGGFKAAGMNPERAAQVAADTVSALAEDPQSSLNFVNKLKS